MSVILTDFDNLTPKQLHDCLYLRQQVFVLEQKCLYPDIDQSDPLATHLMLYKGNELSAYLRIFPPDVKFKEAAIGRIVVDKLYRGSGVGQKLIKSGIEYCKNSFPDAGIRIEAQAALISYYEQYGFKKVSDVYVVDGIDHIQMVIT